MDRIALGDVDDEFVEKEGKVEGVGESEPVILTDIGQEPPPPKFIIDLPNISSIDL
jgi:splicing factor 3A subunit 1